MDYIAGYFYDERLTKSNGKLAQLSFSYEYSAPYNELSSIRQTKNYPGIQSTAAFYKIVTNVRVKPCMPKLPPQLTTVINPL
jgi:hypothetical protein